MGIHQRRNIPRGFAEVSGAHHAPHHFGVARLGQVADEEQRLGRQGLAERNHQAGAQFFAQLFTGFGARRQHAEANDLVTFQLVGDGDGRGLDDLWMRHKHGFNFGGAEALSGHFDGVI